MDYSQPQQPVQEKKSLTDHIGNAWSGFKGMFSDNASEASPSQAIGGRRSHRRHRKTMKGGMSKKNVKSLCKGKKIHSPNKCKKIRGCKVASGKKRSFCRKSKNHTKKAKK